MAFIRKVRTASGAIAVQIAHKKHGRITRIEHIGSAHSKAELGTLLSLAKQRLRGDQLSLFAETVSPLKISRELPCAKSTGRLNDFIVQTTLAV